MNRDLRSIRFASLDFTCASPVQIADIDTGRFTGYTRAQNLALVRRSTRNTSFLRNTPEAEIEDTARWPERSACVTAARR